MIREVESKRQSPFKIHLAAGILGSTLPRRQKFTGKGVNSILHGRKTGDGFGAQRPHKGIVAYRNAGMDPLIQGTIQRGNGHIAGFIQICAQTAT